MERTSFLFRWNIIVEIENSFENEIDKNDIDENEIDKEENVTKIVVILPVYDSNRNRVLDHGSNIIDGPVHYSSSNSVSEHGDCYKSEIEIE